MSAETLAKAIRPLTEEEVLWKSKATKLYQRLAAHSITSMREVVPLEAIEPNRRRVGYSKNDAMTLRELR